jgi:broad specificity phosphatase PhoE
MDKTLVYFIRHAQSEYNVYEEKQTEIHSIINPDLTNLGLNQCQELSEKLKIVNFDLVICSPLKRCLKTFELSKIIFDKFEIWEFCREFKTNECDFLEHEEVKFENLEELYERINIFKKEFLIILDKNQYSHIAVFTHADFIYHILETNKQDESSRFWLDNADFRIISAEKLFLK